MYCSQCGKKLPDGVTVCECRSQAPQPPVASVVAPDGESAPVAQPAPVLPETPVVNGAPVVGAVSVAVPDVDCDREFLEVIKSCKLINILGIVLFVTGLVSLIFINGWVAAVVFLVGELFVLMPNTKVQKLCKAKNPTADKKSLQKITKETVKGLKAKDKNFKFSFIIAIVCLACLILSFVVPSPFVSSDSGGDYESDVEEVGAIIPATEADDSETKSSTSNKSDSNKPSKVVKEPVIGSFDYYETTDTDTMKSLSNDNNYISHIYFNEDGTGNMTIKTSTQKNGNAIYKTTWELVEVSGEDRQYVIRTHTNETFHVNYAGEKDICIIFVVREGRNLAYTLTRFSGNAQENISGGKAVTSHDVIGTYWFSYATDPTTGQKIVSPNPPYVSSIFIGDGGITGGDGMCSMSVKTGSSGTASMDFWVGKWTHEESKDGYMVYKLVMNNGSITKPLMYVPANDTCMLTDDSGTLYYYERKAD